MKKLTALLLALVLVLSLGAVALAQEAPKAAKYVFLFIGDGMGSPQISATQYFIGTQKNPDSPLPVPAPLSFTGFKNVGIMTTFDASSFCPDSASTATSMSTGQKTLSGVLNYDVNKEKTFKLVTEYAKAAGKKIGVVTTVSLDHATPAAFYAKAQSRNMYYEIALQGASEKLVDFLGGGSFLSPKGKEKDKKDVVEAARENGYTIINTAEAIRALGAQAAPVIASVPDLAGSAAMQYEVDRVNAKDSVSLAEMTQAAIRSLDNDKGFFMMVEGGKIDWSCHANDAITSIYETIAFADAVQAARDFAAQHPDETLIVVTGDHETGGMTIGFATTAYETHFNYLQKQNISYENFDKKVGEMREGKVKFKDALKTIEAAYGLKAPAKAEAKKDEKAAEATPAPAGEAKDDGLLLNAKELDALKAAYELSMLPKDQRVIGDQEKLLYGGYEPLTVTANHILNNKAGIAFTSYAHTGLQIPVYADGANAQLFVGSYDNTDIFHKLMQAMDLKEDAAAVASK